MALCGLCRCFFSSSSLYKKISIFLLFKNEEEKECLGFKYQTKIQLANIIRTQFVISKIKESFV